MVASVNLAQECPMRPYLEAMMGAVVQSMNAMKCAGRV